MRTERDGRVGRVLDVGIEPRELDRGRVGIKNGGRGWWRGRVKDEFVGRRAL